MKKLLILGGAYSQISAIKRAKELGYYVITCDYLPENPGHKYSDEYINLSTTDIEKVLSVCEEKGINGIISYGSDPGAVTAAYVSDRLHLDGGGLSATQILARKDKFREFQRDNQMDFPAFVCCSEKADTERIKNFALPCIVKPVDSSGSKGITVVNNRQDLINAFDYAVSFSRIGKVIFEEFIETACHQLHGDGIVLDGELVFMELGEQRFRNCVPIGSSCPANISDEIKRIAWNEVDRHIKKSGFRSGGINIELRISLDGKLYIVEIGPRTGGNYIPELMLTATGFDEISASLQLAMGEFDAAKYKRVHTQYCFQYIIGSHADGIFDQVYIYEEIKSQIEFLWIHKKRGDRVFDYRNSSGVVGVAIIKFPNRQQMESVIAKIDDYIRVELVEKKYETKRSEEHTSELQSH